MSDLGDGIFGVEYYENALGDKQGGEELLALLEDVQAGKVTSVNNHEFQNVLEHLLDLFSKHEGDKLEEQKLFDVFETFIKSVELNKFRLKAAIINTYVIAGFGIFHLGAFVNWLFAHPAGTLRTRAEVLKYFVNGENRKLYLPGLQAQLNPGERVAGAVMSKTRMGCDDIVLLSETYRETDPLLTKVFTTLISDYLAGQTVTMFSSGSKTSFTEEHVEKYVALAKSSLAN